MSTSLIKKIELLPADLIIKVDDFVDFLISKYEKGEEVDFEISDADKKELNERWEDYLKNPDANITVEEFKEKYNKKYGL